MQRAATVNGQAAAMMRARIDLPFVVGRPPHCTIIQMGEREITRVDVIEIAPENNGADIGPGHRGAAALAGMHRQAAVGAKTRAVVSGLSGVDRDT